MFLRAMIAMGLVGALLAPPAAASGPGRCGIDLRPELGRLHVPGLAAGIVKDGKLVCTAVAGWADRERRRPVTADTAFLLASVSKTVTATAVMLLVERGRIRGLDDDVNRYLPFLVRNPRCRDPITIRQLMTHTSSIRDGVFDDSSHPGDDATQLDPARLGKVLPHRIGFDLKRCPGRVSSYSNVGVTLLGYLVQVVSGKPFQRFTREEIFRPLGMRNTSWSLAGLSDRSRLAVPYGPKRLAQYGEWDYPDGMLRTSVTQLAKFLCGRVLRKDTVAEMRRRQTPLDRDQGLVYFYESFGPHSRNVVGHNGDDDGTASSMFLDPATGTGVILLANADWFDYGGGDDTPASKSLIDRLFAIGRAAS